MKHILPNDIRFCGAVQVDMQVIQPVCLTDKEVQIRQERDRLCSIGELTECLADEFAHTLFIGQPIQ